MASEIVGAYLVKDGRLTRVAKKKVGVAGLDWWVSTGDDVPVVRVGNEEAAGYLVTIVTRYREKVRKEADDDGDKS